jgi:hypothetical protein
VDIFVCYSHCDRKWIGLDEAWDYPIIPFLAEALHKDGARFWYDEHESEGLRAGDEFRRKIEQQIDTSTFAILMVSQAFLNSVFIQNVELPRIIDRVQRDEMGVILILLEPCDWEADRFLGSRKVIPMKPKFLIDFIDSPKEWSHVRADTLKAVRSRLRDDIHEPPPPHLGDTHVAPLLPPTDGLVRRLRRLVSAHRVGTTSVLVVAVVVIAVAWGALRGTRGGSGTGTVVVQPGGSTATTVEAPSGGPASIVHGRLLYDEMPVSGATVRFLLEGDDSKGYETLSGKTGEYSVHVAAGDYFLDYKLPRQPVPVDAGSWNPHYYQPPYDTLAQPLVVQARSDVTVPDLAAVFDEGITFTSPSGPPTPTVADRPAFEWHPWSDTNHYEVSIQQGEWLDRSSYAPSVLETASVSTPGYAVTHSLSPGSGYSCRVIAYNAKGHALANGVLDFAVATKGVRTKPLGTSR